jgi:hypothetical protein
MARMTLDDLVGQLRAAYGDALRAVVLYGSAVDAARVPPPRARRAAARAPRTTCWS